MVYKDSFKAMGTDVQILIHPEHIDTNHKIGQAIKRARDRISELEELLSRFRPDSDISRLNHSQGQWVDVHPATLEVLTLAKKAYERTNGLFNPCLGTIMEHIGYNVTFHDIPVGDNPSAKFYYYVPFIPPMNCPFQLDEQTFQVLLEPNFKVDLGGIAKGWIVEQACSEMQKAGITNVLFSAGGDMVCTGHAGDSPWCIGIACPLAIDSTVLNLDISDLCVATSGTYRRKWSHHGQQVHHLIDPFLGRPANSDIVSCTIIHQSLPEAEVMAKTTLLLGKTKGLQWLQNQCTNGFVIITTQGEVIHSWNL